VPLVPFVVSSLFPSVLISRVFLQPGGCFTNFEAAIAGFNDDITEYNGIDKALDIRHGLFSKRRANFVGEAAAVNGEDFHQVDFLRRVQTLDFDVEKRVSNGFKGHSG